MIQKTKSRSVSKSPQNVKSLIPSPINSRKVETANHAPSKEKPAKSQVSKVPNNRSDQRKLSVREVASRSPKSVNQVHSRGVLQLYDYGILESATNLLRYRHFLKRHTKLMRELFARYHGNESNKSRVLKSQQTFDKQQQQSKVISSTNLLRMVKELDLMPQQDSFISQLRIRQDIPALVKLINRLTDVGIETKFSELSYEGFVEFLLQYAHSLWNDNTARQLLAVELSEKLLEHLKHVNKERRLMISLKHFVGNNYLASGNPEEEEMLELLNQKVEQDPDFPVPDGYRKVQEIVIEDSYLVPAELGMKAGEKIGLELMDEIVNAAFPGLHILQSVPVTRTVTRVILDEKKIFLNYAAASRNIRSNSVGSNGDR